MSGSTNKFPAARGTSTLVRPRFGPGMLLQHDDLDLATDYTRDLSRLLFRSLFGCGVVCGLEVKYDPKCRDTITVDSGVGLVCAGDPVYVPRQQTIVLAEACVGIEQTELWVVLCGTAKACSPRPSMCASDDDELLSAATRERYGFEIRVLEERPKCACWCEPPKEDYVAMASDCACVDPEHPCYKDHYAGQCGCECEGGDGCCDCIVLARINRASQEDTDWTVAHNVRRFVRPVLMRDPLAWADGDVKKKKKKESAGGTPKRRRDSPIV